MTSSTVCMCVCACPLTHVCTHKHDNVSSHTSVWFQTEICIPLPSVIGNIKQSLFGSSKMLYIYPPACNVSDVKLEMYPINLNRVIELLLFLRPLFQLSFQKGFIEQWRFLEDEVCILGFSIFAVGHYLFQSVKCM